MVIVRFEHYLVTLQVETPRAGSSNRSRTLHKAPADHLAYSKLKETTKTATLKPVKNLLPEILPMEAEVLTEKH